MIEFRVREWLAGYAGCEPEDIEPVGAVRATARGQEARYEVRGQELALVIVTWPVAVEPSCGSCWRQSVIARVRRTSCTALSA
jgi:hypothetical protein